MNRKEKTFENCLVVFLSNRIFSVIFVILKRLEREKESELNWLTVTVCIIIWVQLLNHHTLTRHIIAQLMIWLICGKTTKKKNLTIKIIPKCQNIYTKNVKTIALIYTIVKFERDCRRWIDEYRYNLDNWEKKEDNVRVRFMRRKQQKDCV